jgi:hypothetical protein
MPKTPPITRHPLPPVEALHRLQHTHQAVLEQIEADRDKLDKSMGAAKAKILKEKKNERKTRTNETNL